MTNAVCYNAEITIESIDMGKVCTSCGTGPAEPKKAPEAEEDCENCGGEGTVKGKHEDESTS